MQLTAFHSDLCLRLLAAGCRAAVRPCRGASDVFESEDVEGGEAERAQALSPDRVQHEERLPGQGHLRGVRTRIWPIAVWRSYVERVCFCPATKTQNWKHLLVHNEQQGRSVCSSQFIFVSSLCCFFPTDYLSGWSRSSTTASVQTNPCGATS